MKRIIVIAALAVVISLPAMAQTQEETIVAAAAPVGSLAFQPRVPAVAVPSQRIELATVPKPKVGDACVYSESDFSKTEQFVEQVVSLGPGAYRVQRTGPDGQVSFRIYSYEGNTFMDNSRGFLERFRYPVVAGQEWTTRSVFTPRGKTVTFVTTSAVKSVGTHVVSGLASPVRVFSVESGSPFVGHVPSGTPEHGYDSQQIVYAPDIHCVVSHEHRVTVNNTSLKRLSVKLLRYQAAADQ